MIKENLKNFSWDFYSKLIIMGYCVLQITRWRIFPQFMDIYYHLLTAWGFIQAGGYSSWDFWQYAPVGRIHIYPPLFHLLLAIFIKLGANKLILAKIFETISPLIFLSSIWFFTKRNFSPRMAFFVIVSATSSFSFYMNLINHIPAVLAILFGIFSLDQLLKNKPARSTLLLTLCFYTHLGISWFFGMAVLLYSLFDKNFRKICLKVFFSSIFFSLPIIIQELRGIGAISQIGLNLIEKYNCQYKIIEYLLALFGAIISFKKGSKYRIFLGLLCASFIFFPYPYRFFSAEGYLPIIFLSGVCLEFLFFKLYRLYRKLRIKREHLRIQAILLLVTYCFFISPSMITSFDWEHKKINFRFLFGHTAFMGMLLPEDESRGFSNLIWLAYHPKKFLAAAEFIKKNSQKDDIVFCSINLLGMCLATFAERATANALFPEIGPSSKFDPFLVSKIIIFGKIEAPDYINKSVDYYGLIKLKEDDMFIFYKNPACKYAMNKKSSVLPFAIILVIGFIFLVFFIKN